MVDRELLEVVMLNGDALVHPEDAAESAAIELEDAERRLEQLANDGYLSKIMTTWGGSKAWNLAGYGITPKGRRAIEGDEG